MLLAERGWRSLVQGAASPESTQFVEVKIHALYWLLARRGGTVKETTRFQSELQDASHPGSRYHRLRPRGLCQGQIQSITDLVQFQSMHPAVTVDRQQRVCKRGDVAMSGTIPTKGLNLVGDLGYLYAQAEREGVEFRQEMGEIRPDGELQQ